MFKMGPVEKGICDHLWLFRRLGKADYKITRAAACLIKPLSFQIKEIKSRSSQECVFSISSGVQGMKRITFMPAEIIDQSGRSLQYQIFKRFEIQTDVYGETGPNCGYPDRVRALIKDACKERGEAWPPLNFEERGVSVVINAPFNDFRNGKSLEMNHVAFVVGRLRTPLDASRHLPYSAAQLIFSNFSSVEMISCLSPDRLSQLSFSLMIQRKKYLPNWA